MTTEQKLLLADTVKQLTTINGTLLDLINELDKEEQHDLMNPINRIVDATTLIYQSIK